MLAKQPFAKIPHTLCKQRHKTLGPELIEYHAMHVRNQIVTLQTNEKAFLLAAHNWIEGNGTAASAFCKRRESECNPSGLYIDVGVQCWKNLYCASIPLKLLNVVCFFVKKIVLYHSPKSREREREGGVRQREGGDRQREGGRGEGGEERKGKREGGRERGRDSETEREREGGGEGGGERKGEREGGRVRGRNSETERERETVRQAETVRQRYTERERES